MNISKLNSESRILQIIDTNLSYRKWVNQLILSISKKSRIIETIPIVISRVKSDIDKINLFLSLKGFRRIGVMNEYDKKDIEKFMPDSSNDIIILPYFGAEPNSIFNWVRRNKGFNDREGIVYYGPDNPDVAIYIENFVKNVPVQLIVGGPIRKYLLSNNPSITLTDLKPDVLMQKTKILIDPVGIPNQNFNILNMMVGGMAVVVSKDSETKRHINTDDCSNYDCFTKTINELLTNKDKWISNSEKIKLQSQSDKLLDRIKFLSDIELTKITNPSIYIAFFGDWNKQGKYIVKFLKKFENSFASIVIPNNSKIKNTVISMMNGLNYSIHVNDDDLITKGNLALLDIFPSIDKILMISGNSYPIYDSLINLINTPIGYDMVCSISFNNDLLNKEVCSTRDVSGDGITQDFPWIKHKDYHMNVKKGYPIQVYSCWSDIMILNSKPFLREKIKFRNGSSGIEKISSNKELLSRDLWSHGYSRVFINPRVQIASKKHVLNKIESTPFLQKLKSNDIKISGFSNDLIFESPRYILTCTSNNQCEFNFNLKNPTIGIIGTFLKTDIISKNNKKLSKISKEKVNGNIYLFPTDESSYDINSRIIEDLHFFKPRSMYDLNIYSSLQPDFSISFRKRGRNIIYLTWPFGYLPKKWVIQSEKFDEIWTFSEYEKQIFIESGIDDSKIISMPEIIDPIYFSNNIDESQIPSKFPISNETIKFLYMGNTDIYSGFDILIDVYKSVFVNKSVSLTVVSDDYIPKSWDGPNLYYFRNYSYLNDEQIASIMKIHTHIVYPYRYSVSASLAIKAMALGIPVIVTQSGPANDFATNDNSFLITSRKVICSSPKCTNNRVCISNECLETVDIPYLLEPSIDSLASSMLYASSNNVICKEKAERAKRDINSIYKFKIRIRSLRSKLSFRKQKGIYNIDLEEIDLITNNIQFINHGEEGEELSRLWELRERIEDPEARINWYCQFCNIFVKVYSNWDVPLPQDSFKMKNFPKFVEKDFASPVEFINLTLDILKLLIEKLTWEEEFNEYQIYHEFIYPISISIKASQCMSESEYNLIYLVSKGYIQILNKLAIISIKISKLSDLSTKLLSKYIIENIIKVYARLEVSHIESIETPNFLFEFLPLLSIEYQSIQNLLNLFMVMIQKRKISIQNSEILLELIIPILSVPVKETIIEKAEFNYYEIEKVQDAEYTVISLVIKLILALISTYDIHFKIDFRQLSSMILWIVKEYKDSSEWEPEIEKVEIEESFEAPEPNQIKPFLVAFSSTEDCKLPGVSFDYEYPHNSKLFGLFQNLLSIVKIIPEFGSTLIHIAVDILRKEIPETEDIIEYIKINPVLLGYLIHIISRVLDSRNLKFIRYHQLWEVFSIWVSDFRKGHSETKNRFEFIIRMLFDLVKQAGSISRESNIEEVRFLLKFIQFSSDLKISYLACKSLLILTKAQFTKTTLSVFKENAMEIICGFIHHLSQMPRTSKVNYSPELYYNIRNCGFELFDILTSNRDYRLKICTNNYISSTVIYLIFTPSTQQYALYKLFSLASLTTEDYLPYIPLLESLNKALKVMISDLDTASLIPKLVQKIKHLVIKFPPIRPALPISGIYKTLKLLLEDPLMNSLLISDIIEIFGTTFDFLENLYLFEKQIGFIKFATQLSKIDFNFNDLINILGNDFENLKRIQYAPVVKTIFNYVDIKEELFLDTIELFTTLCNNSVDNSSICSEVGLFRFLSERVKKSPEKIINLIVIIGSQTLSVDGLKSYFSITQNEIFPEIYEKWLDGLETMSSHSHMHPRSFLRFSGNNILKIPSINKWPSRSYGIFLWILINPRIQTQKQYIFSIRTRGKSNSGVELFIKNNDEIIYQVDRKGSISKIKTKLPIQYQNKWIFLSISHSHSRISHRSAISISINNEVLTELGEKLSFPITNCEYNKNSVGGILIRGGSAEKEHFKGAISSIIFIHDSQQLNIQEFYKIGPNSTEFPNSFLIIHSKKEHNPIIARSFHEILYVLGGMKVLFHLLNEIPLTNQTLLKIIKMVRDLLIIHKPNQDEMLSIHGFSILSSKLEKVESSVLTNEIVSILRELLFEIQNPELLIELIDLFENFKIWIRTSKETQDIVIKSLCSLDEGFNSKDVITLLLHIPFKKKNRNQLLQHLQLINSEIDSILEYCIHRDDVSDILETIYSIVINKKGCIGDKRILLNLLSHRKEKVLDASIRILLEITKLTELDISFIENKIKERYSPLLFNSCLSILFNTNNKSKFKKIKNYSILSLIFEWGDFHLNEIKKIGKLLNYNESKEYWWFGWLSKFIINTEDTAKYLLSVVKESVEEFNKFFSLTEEEKNLIILQSILSINSLDIETILKILPQIYRQLNGNFEHDIVSNLFDIVLKYSKRDLDYEFHNNINLLGNLGLKKNRISIIVKCFQMDSTTYSLAIKAKEKLNLPAPFDDRDIEDFDLVIKKLLNQLEEQNNLNKEQLIITKQRFHMSLRMNFLKYEEEIKTFFSTRPIPELKINLIQELKNSRSPWDPRIIKYWKLDETENNRFCRLKMKENPIYNVYKEASIRRDIGEEIQNPNLINSESELKVNTTSFEFISECNRVFYLSNIPGIIHKSKKEILFKSLNDEDVISGNSCLINVNSIKGLSKMRFMHKNIGLEIISNFNKERLFLTFLNEKSRDRVFRKILKISNPELIIGENPKEVFRRGKMTKKWIKREISNFEYLMWLNNISGRTYIDLSQYPVFPWILRDYESKELDLFNPEIYRDLSKPIGALNPERLEKYESRYKSLIGGEIPPFFYGSHYSSSGVVLYFLLRMEPFTKLHIQLHGDRFDKADRIFSSFQRSWNNALILSSDVKELIPELFYQPECLINRNGFDLGKRRSDGAIVNDVILPPWAESPHHFIELHRRALESEYVSLHLNEWIDLIFGYKQKGEEAIKNNNLFYHLTYFDQIPESNDPVQIAAIENQIACFGITPFQLTKKPHPSRAPASIPELYKIPAINNVSFVGFNGKVIIVTDYDIPGIPWKTYGTINRLLQWGIVSCGYWDNSIKITNFNRKLILTVIRHLDIVTCVDVYQNYIVSGSRDATLILWKINNNPKSILPIKTLRGHDSCITSVSITSGLIVSGSTDKTIIIWSNEEFLCKIFIGNSINLCKIDDISGRILIISGSELYVYSLIGERINQMSVGIDAVDLQIDGTNIIIAWKDHIDVRDGIFLSLIEAFDVIDCIQINIPQPGQIIGASPRGVFTVSY